MPSFWENIRFADESESVMVSQGMDMATYVSHPPPSEGNSFPAVIVVMEAFGVTRHIEQVCDEYARHGYVAVAPSLYHRDSPNIKLGYDQMPQVQQHMGALQDDQLIEDINKTIDYVQHRYQRTRGNKVGIVGYCVGGRITYLAATSCPGLSAASVYYGGRILVPFGDGPAPIERTSASTIPVMGNFGEDDANPTPTDVAQIEEALKAAGVTHDFKMYSGAGHGFNCNERPDYREDAAADALARTLGWFDKYVKN